MEHYTLQASSHVTQEFVGYPGTGTRPLCSALGALWGVLTGPRTAFLAQMAPLSVGTRTPKLTMTSERDGWEFILNGGFLPHELFFRRSKERTLFKIEAGHTTVTFND
jgi:hypothetical protein